MKPLSMKWFALLGLVLFLGVAVAPNIVGETEELPDLIVERIYIQFINDHDVGYIMKNIGIANVSEGFNISINVQHLLLGIYKGMILYNFTEYFSGVIFKPGMYFLYRHSLDKIPKKLYPRMYRFSCEINPSCIIPESDYSNNRLQKDFINFFRNFWIPLS